MNIAVIGAGYVGLVTAAGLASLGHRVRVGEADADRLALLQAGGVPLHEAGLSQTLTDVTRSGGLTFHADNGEAVDSAKVVIIALPTPPTADGSADLSIIESALDDLASALESGTTVAVKSTVPVGSNERFQTILDAHGADVTVVSNPEFLREGTALEQFLNPDRIVIGSPTPQAAAPVIEMYETLDAPVVVTDRKSSEMIKYASNAYLAMRITFANSIANLCESVGADAAIVLEAMGHDARIGPQFLNPGPGYGGSCFPKDTRALVSIADDAGYDFALLREVIDANERQTQRIVDKVTAAVPNLDGAAVGMWGMAFKAGTDDTRESPALKIAHYLVAAGANVVAHDPVVHIEETDGITMAAGPIEAVEGADVLVVATEWPEYTAIDLNAVREAMRGSTIVDARNLLDPDAVHSAGLTYTGVGR